MPRSLVAGGAGFVGSHLVEALVASGRTVVVADNYCTGRPENLAHLAHQIEMVDVDISDTMRFVALKNEYRGRLEEN